MAKVIGCHACERSFAGRLQSGELATSEWMPSQNDYDWLGHGIYFWEGSLRRAQEWGAAHVDGEVAVIEAEIELGICFDLTNSPFLPLLTLAYGVAATVYEDRGWALPTNEAGGRRLRRLDCLVINEFLKMMDLSGVNFQTVRCPFEEGEPVFPGSMIRSQTHIQIAVRDSSCISVRNLDAK